MGKVALFVGRMSQELNNVTWRRIICDIHVYPSILAASSASRTDLRGGFSEFFWREAFWCSSFPSGRAYHARELAVKIPFSHFFCFFPLGCSSSWAKSLGEHVLCRRQEWLLQCHTTNEVQFYHSSFSMTFIGAKSDEFHHQEAHWVNW